MDLDLKCKLLESNLVTVKKINEIKIAQLKTQLKNGISVSKEVEKERFIKHLKEINRQIKWILDTCS
jgi:hypothetical protein